MTAGFLVRFAVAGSVAAAVAGLATFAGNEPTQPPPGQSSALGVTRPGPHGIGPFSAPDTPEVRGLKSICSVATGDDGWH